MTRPAAMRQLASLIDQREVAQTVCTTKEFAAWEAINLRGLTLRAAGNALGITHSSVRDRIENAQRKINAYSRSEFPAKTQPEVTPDPDAPIRMIIGLLIQRDGPNCYLCRRPAVTHKARVEHIIPKLHGGTDDPENLALACDQCNAKKGAKFVSLRTTSGRPVYHHG